MEFQMTDATTVIECLRTGDADSIAAMLKTNQELARSRNPQGVSVICLAVYFGQPRSAALLAASRTDLDIFEASVLGCVEHVQSLITQDAALKDAYSPDGFHPLGYACFFGRRDLFDALVASGADINAPARNPMKVCPLHSAVASPDPDTALYMAKRLIDRGASVNARQQGDFTPLHEAAHRGHAALVDLLLTSGADKGLRNHEGHNAAELARASGHLELAARLDSAS